VVGAGINFIAFNEGTEKKKRIERKKFSAIWGVEGATTKRQVSEKNIIGRK